MTSCIRRTVVKIKNYRRSRRRSPTVSCYLHKPSSGQKDWMRMTKRKLDWRITLLQVHPHSKSSHFTMNDLHESCRPTKAKVLDRRTAEWGWRNGNWTDASPCFKFAHTLNQVTSRWMTCTRQMQRTERTKTDHLSLKDPVFSRIGIC